MIVLVPYQQVNNYGELLGALAGYATAIVLFGIVLHYPTICKFVKYKVKVEEWVAIFVVSTFTICLFLP